jgi:hypothetical protein
MEKQQLQHLAVAGEAHINSQMAQHFQLTLLRYQLEQML